MRRTAAGWRGAVVRVTAPTRLLLLRRDAGECLVGGSGRGRPAAVAGAGARAAPAAAFAPTGL